MIWRLHRNSCAHSARRNCRRICPSVRWTIASFLGEWFIDSSIPFINPLGDVRLCNFLRGKMLMYQTFCPQVVATTNPSFRRTCLQTSLTFDLAEVPQFISQMQTAYLENITTCWAANSPNSMHRAEMFEYAFLGAFV